MMKASLTDLAEKYFDFMAKSFPVMCTSDEFHFLPRAQAAYKYLDRLDNLQAESIIDTISTLKEFQIKFNKLSVQENDSEMRTDTKLLMSNIEGALIELEMIQSWRHNPLLYLKIAFIGLDHAITKPAFSLEERLERTLARLKAIPRLLNQAMNNLDSAPKTYLEAALTMLDDAKTYLEEISHPLAMEPAMLDKEAIQKTIASLEAFERFLLTITPIRNHNFLIPAIEATLKEHFLSIRTLPEILQIAEQEWHENMGQLEKLRSNIEPSKSWLELYDSYLPYELNKIDTLSLYNREIELLSLFFQENGFGETDLHTSFELCETPTYLRSVRSSASFSAALNANTGEKDLFYITTFQPGTRNKKEGGLMKKRLHREYKFLTAHEVIPGHHQLDYGRRKHENPIRRQIESPLFYEGWACYAETLLSEYGYVEDQMQKLVDYKRRLWRAARCKIDVGLNSGILSGKDALQILTEVGFSPEEAESQVNRIRLSPGYQLCYSLGRYEIMKLRQAYAERLGLDRFHHLLLEGGELPFQLIEKRLEALEPGEEKSKRE